jgi:hypothetical protein
MAAISAAFGLEACGVAETGVGAGREPAGRFMKPGSTGSVSG